MQLVVSSVAYRTGLGVLQFVGGCLRVACTTPVLGPGMGLFAVSSACALSGQVCRHAKRELDAGCGPVRLLLSLPRAFDRVKVEELLVDALLGALCFKMCKGSFRRIMPSNLKKVGANAHLSIPIGSTEYKNPVQKNHLEAIFRRDGCHHCGSRRGEVIGDHIPPNKVVKDAVAAAASNDFFQALVTKAASALRLVDDPAVVQRYYAQCRSCSDQQGSLLRHPSWRGRNPFWPAHLKQHWAMGGAGLVPELATHLELASAHNVAGRCLLAASNPRSSNNYASVFRTVTKDSPDSCSTSGCDSAGSSPGLDSRRTTARSPPQYTSHHDIAAQHATYHATRAAGRSGGAQELFRCSVTIEDEEGEGGLSERLHGAGNGGVGGGGGRLGRNFVHDAQQQQQQHGGVGGGAMVLGRSFEVEQAGAGGSSGCAAALIDTWPRSTGALASRSAPLTATGLNLPHDGGSSRYLSLRDSTGEDLNQTRTYNMYGQARYSPGKRTQYAAAYASAAQEGSATGRPASRGGEGI
ncbi:MAG: hypothetical protein WDW38_002837 [Sanguina aurantia]